MKLNTLLFTLLTTSSVFLSAQEKEDFIYANMETVNANHLQQENPKSIQILSSKNGISAIYFDPEIAHSLHHKFAHGHGYIYRESENSAINSLEVVTKKVTQQFNYTITEQVYVNKILNDVDPKEIEKNILLLEGFKTRFHKRQEANDAVYKMKEVWEKIIADYGRTDVAVKVVDHVGTPMKSLILTINGNSKSDEYVIIGGHIDSIVSWGDGTQENAPGADDNASGISTITEVIRVLLKNNFKPERTTQMMAYAAEEIGLVGSSEIAKQYAADGKNVVSYLQFDMTNYKGSAKDVILMTDAYCDANLNAYLMQLMDVYNTSGLHQFTYDTSKCGYGCSDHYSWAENGFPATLPFESKMNEDNPNIHSTSDTYAFMGNTANHAAKFTKLGIEFVVETAKSATLSTDDLNSVSSKIYVENKTLNYRFNTNSNYSIQIVDASGRQLINLTNKSANGNVDLSNLNAGFYVAIFKDNSGKRTSHKIIIK
ncbi:Bacterial leucyl aminopeptidase precursor [Algoriella xinjiangensis]|uniref:M20/M25/M40 family metallo-hydrolase n=1 Tax=Algoriella xinjiangensis TaxID=684065 RepID=UPI000F99F05E|nr:M20/M25/M40 family metallo-hydrolase [Algoriella xinjiangensis]VDH16975.1 Bacterial leucyl aminopeptidase precursor [Algoriella xinjiangensis]